MKEKGIAAAVIVVVLVVAGVGAYFLTRGEGLPSVWTIEGVVIPGGYCDAEVVELPDGGYRTEMHARESA